MLADKAILFKVFFLHIKIYVFETRIGPEMDYFERKETLVVKEKNFKHYVRKSIVQNFVVFNGFLTCM